MERGKRHGAKDVALEGFFENDFIKMSRSFVIFAPGRSSTQGNKKPSLKRIHVHYD